MKPILALGTGICLTSLAVACGGQTGGNGAQPDGGAGKGATGGTSAAGGMGGTGATGGTLLTGGMGGIPATGGLGGTGGISGIGQPPPPDPGAPPASGSSPTSLAVRWLSLGDIDRNGVSDPNAWRQFGYNIDGLVSDKNQLNHCKPQAGATKSAIQTDGDNGIDNSFGSNFLPIMASLTSSPSQNVNDAIGQGQFTLLFQLKNLGPEPSQNGVQGAFYTGSMLGAPPTWNGTDIWPVTAESLISPPDVNTPKLAFAQSYLVNGTWVSAAQTTPTPLVMSIGLQGFPMTLTIHYPRVTMTISGTGAQAQGKLGVIAGVLDTEELVVELKKIAGSFDPTLCSGPTFDSIASEIRAGSDIMKDGTNGNPALTCDGISIGLAFEAAPVVLGPAASPVPPPSDPCATP